MRPWVLAVTVVAMGMGGAVEAQSGAFVYAPGTQHYRVTTIRTQTQDQSGGRAPFEYSVTTTEYVTLNLASRGPDTLAMTVTIDSVGVASTLDAMPPDTSGFRGVKLQGTISPQGHIYTFDPPAGTAPGKVTALYRAFRPFLVAFPSTPIAAGLAWNDSTSEVLHHAPFTSLTTTTVTSWKVTGDTTVVGRHAWRVERDDEVTTTGEGNQEGNAIQLTGDGSIRGVRYVSTTGAYLGGTATQNTQTQMTTASGDGTPIRQTIKSTVDLLP